MIAIAFYCGVFIALILLYWIAVAGKRENELVVDRQYKQYRQLEDKYFNALDTIKRLQKEVASKDRNAARVQMDKESFARQLNEEHGRLVELEGKLGSAEAQLSMIRHMFVEPKENDLIPEKYKERFDSTLKALEYIPIEVKSGENDDLSEGFLPSGQDKPESDDVNT